MLTMSKLPPSTADYVRFHALHRPSSVALINRGKEVTYAKFYRDIRKLAHALRKFAPPAGGTVAVECDDVYLHWLILLACESLGLVTGSFLGNNDPGSGALLAYVDLVICEHDFPASRCKAVHKLTQSWVTEALSQDEPPEDASNEEAIALDRPQRVRRSSGSTGTQKMMLASRYGEEIALAAYATHMSLSKDTRLLITSYFTVTSMYLRATACLRLGATSIFDARMTLAQAIVAYKPTHVRLFQYQAALVLSELPSTYRKPERLTVMLGAGPLSDDLRQQIMARLATDIVYTYNTNETMMIAVIDTDGIGTLRPGVEAEVVDDHGGLLPLGSTGRIRIKTEGQVDGYLNDPETTARLFINGWFYPGDIGMSVAPRRLRVLGRSDDVLNIGGLKHLPSVIENEILRKAPFPIKDVGVTSIRGVSGNEEVAVALVLDQSTQLDAVVAWLLGNALSREMGGQIIAVDRLPRTETGKIQRHILKSMFRRQA